MLPPGVFSFVSIVKKGDYSTLKGMNRRQCLSKGGSRCRYELTHTADTQTMNTIIRQNQLPSCCNDKFSSIV